MLEKTQMSASQAPQVNVGNRLSNLAGSGWSNNSSNELTSRPGVTYTYDSNGNMLTKVDSTGTTHYTWDFENRLTSVQLPGSGGTITFKYDAFGRRVEKISSSATSIYVYDGDNLVEETNSVGSAVARYTQGLNIDEPLAMLRGSTTSYYSADGLGSVTSLTNTSGANAQTYTYDSFGNLTASSGSLTNSFRYTAREFDTETSLYYYRARYYDPAAGRFLSEDPSGFREGVNFYKYGGNNAVNLTDPMGLDNDSEYCRRLAEKIENIRKSIQRRIGQLDENPDNLPESCPGDRLNPGLSKRGHRFLINMDKARLAAREAEYIIFCKDFPPLPPVPVPVPHSSPQAAYNAGAGLVVVVIIIILSPVFL
jgi:RHS repeat-associated protein